MFGGGSLQKGDGKRGLVFRSAAVRIQDAFGQIYFVRGLGLGTKRSSHVLVEPLTCTFQTQLVIPLLKKLCFYFQGAPRLWFVMRFQVMDSHNSRDVWKHVNHVFSRQKQMETGSRFQVPDLLVQS